MGSSIFWSVEYGWILLKHILVCPLMISWILMIPVIIHIMKYHDGACHLSLVCSGCVRTVLRAFCHLVGQRVNSRIAELWFGLDWVWCLTRNHWCLYFQNGSTWGSIWHPMLEQKNTNVYASNCVRVNHHKNWQILMLIALRMMS